MGASAARTAVLPSFLMVLTIGKAYVSFGGTRIISALFYGIGAAVIAIVFFLKSSLFVFGSGLAIVVFVLTPACPRIRMATGWKYMKFKVEVG